ncbi:MAG: hypothetical protein EA402_07750 [Planctomycetota bacterium]|nr:MAG: hypothetical protein EA402_07750 [Planctomycetota bacterium]
MHGKDEILGIDKRLHFGVCYYPDHWPQERWAYDMQLMRDAGLECFRWLEGSWTLVEPEEGGFDFSLVDAVLECADRHGLGVILGTPTYAVPAWAVERYPDIVARRRDGSAWYHGSRRCWDYTNGDYRRLCDRVVVELAQRYAKDSRVWAWQVDNEMWCHLDELWGEGVERAFQDWCRQRYHQPEALNQAWGLAFWSRQIAHFGQVTLPGPTPAHLNHHQVADYQRFLSDLAIGFLFGQRDAIKAVNPQAAVLHNCPFEPIDRPRLLEGLDIYGHDHYPAFAGGAAGRPQMGLNYGRFRRYAKRLWVVEQQASQVGQTSYRLPTAPPGDLSVSALQSIGHGCDLLAWFRWRSYPAAQETNWGGLLPHWGEPGRHYQEMSQLIATLRPHAEAIAATVPQVSVARICSFDQYLVHRAEGWIADRIGGPEVGRGALISLGLNEDQLRATDLDGRYQVALVPHAAALSLADIRALTAFAQAGGVVIIGPLAGHRDAQLHAPDQAPPGDLAALTGTSNAEATTWDEGELSLHEINGGSSVSAGHWAEIIQPVSEGVSICARYATGWLAGRGAVSQRSFGAGRVIHVGVALADPVLSWLWTECALPLPDQPLRVFTLGAEVLTRFGGGHRYHFALNHGEAPAVFEVRRMLTDLATGKLLTGPFTLEARSWRVLHEADPSSQALASS